MPVTGILEGIKRSITSLTGLNADFADNVDLLLQSLGYTLQQTDDYLILFIVQGVAAKIKIECNINAVPDGLFQTAVKIVCGEFLLAKKNSGKLDGFSIDLNSAAVKQIQEGDTNVTFATEGNMPPEKRLDILIDFLINRSREQFIHYRRLKWT